MSYTLLSLVLAVIPTGFCATLQNSNSGQGIQVRKARPRVVDLLTCGLNRDISCFLDTADAVLEQRKTDILAQADREAVKTTGRADEVDKPTQLSKIINRLLSELTEIFRTSLSGFYKNAKEGEDDDDEDDEDDEESDDKLAPKKPGEARKKKKKGKLLALIKLLVIALIIGAKLKLLLKLLSAALQVKFFLVALAGLLLNAVRLYLDLKRGKEPQKVIYYEHAQHQHHYDGGEEDWSSGSPESGGYWGRSYDEETDGSSAQNLAYAKQKPPRYAKKATTASSFPSWFS